MLCIWTVTFFSFLHSAGAEARVWHMLGKPSAPEPHGGPPIPSGHTFLPLHNGRVFRSVDTRAPPCPAQHHVLGHGVLEGGTGESQGPLQ